MCLKPSHKLLFAKNIFSEDPILAYSAAGEINTVQWGPIHNDWIAITYDKTLEILRV